MLILPSLYAQNQPKNKVQRLVFPLDIPKQTENIYKKGESRGTKGA